SRPLAKAPTDAKVTRKTLGREQIGRERGQGPARDPRQYTTPPSFLDGLDLQNKDRQQTPFDKAKGDIDREIFGEQILVVGSIKYEHQNAKTNADRQPNQAVANGTPEVG